MGVRVRDVLIRCIPSGEVAFAHIGMRGLAGRERQTSDLCHGRNGGVSLPGML